MFQESHPLIRRFIRFLLLPYCYFKLVNWKECTAKRWQVLSDLFLIFFDYKYYPDNYGPCRLYEKPKSKWAYYYGSTYNAYPRNRLRKEVQPFEYRILFYDKFLTHQLCKGIDIPTPKCYGTISDQMDYKNSIRDYFQMGNHSELIFKPLRGHAGIDIFIVYSEDDALLVKSKQGVIPLDDLTIDGQYIVQEVIKQHKMINDISPTSLNTVRVVTMLKKNGAAMVVSSSMRFSTGNSVVDNWSAGGIAVGVNHHSGVLKEVAYDKRGNQYLKHPMTKIRLGGIKLPSWREIIDCAMKVQVEFPYYKLLGMDIAVTDNGPMLIEINADSDLIFQEQTSGPLLEDDEVLRVFNDYNLLINKHQKSLFEKVDKE